ncbi:MAG: ABC transporter substrate-binding protein [Spirochaetales bacterium]|nr:ABC transporter substrate-binding protein [Spirochaetales bacterium]
MKRILLLCLPVIFLLSACGNSAPSGEDARGAEKHLVIAVNPDYSSFDPAVSYEAYGVTVIHSCYDTLFEFDGSLDNLRLSIADAYEVSADGLKYTFKLKPNVTFTGGNKLSSADVKWSFERAINIKGNAAFMAAKIAGIDAPDDLSVVLNLNAPDPALPVKLAYSFFAVLDSKAAAEHGATNAADANTADTAKTWLDANSVGSGPYRIESYTPKSELSLVRNPDYWGKASYYDRITIKTIADASTQVMMLQAGDVDIALNVGPEQARELSGKEGITILNAQALTLHFLLMNRDPATGGPVANPKVQKAIRLALDYPGIQAIAGPGTATPSAPFPLGLAGSLPAVNVSAYPKTAEAKALLAEAGYAGGFKTKLYVPTTTVGGVEFVTMAQKIQNDLAAVGIDAEIIPEEITVSLSSYREGRQPLGLWYWNPDYPDNSSQLAFLPGSVVGLRAKWEAKANPALADLGKQASVEANLLKRSELFGKIQEAMIEDTPFAMLVQFTSQYATRSGITGAEYLDRYKIDLKKLAE